MDFSTQTWTFLGIGVGVVVIVVVLGLLARRRSAHRTRTDALRRQFGDEYDATVARIGRRQGEDELEDRTRRFRDLDLGRVTPDSREAFTETWKEVQYRFLEDPVYSVAEAEHLIVNLMRERGFPHGSFDTRTRALSIANPELAEPYRTANATFRAAEDGAATIEAMFAAMLQYRMLFEALLERPKREDGVAGSAPPAGEQAIASGSRSS